MTSSNRVRTSILAACAGVVAVLGLLAGPAGAQTTSQTSGGALATNGSVASGTCVATASPVIGSISPRVGVRRGRQANAAGTRARSEKHMATTSRRVTTLGSLLAGTAGALLLLAGPAGAQTTSQTSGGALATNGSVASGSCVATLDSTCSGSGRASADSTASGSATAANGSTSSGCATAINDSTASGSPCPAAS